jgi:hypothetical protein
LKKVQASRRSIKGDIVLCLRESMYGSAIATS